MSTAPVSLENLTEAEKDRIVNEAQKGIRTGLFLYIIPFLVFGFAIYYINMHYITLGLKPHENWHSAINVSLVILCILPARLFVNTVLRFRKASNSWQKKTIRGKVVSKKGRVILVAGQKIRLDANQAASVKTGDDVIASISVALDYTLSFEILKPQA